MHSHTRRFPGNPIKGLLRDWHILFLKLWVAVKIFIVYYTKSLLAYVLQFHFVTLSDFIKSIRQSLKQSPLISTIPQLTSDFAHRLRKLMRKIVPKSSLHAGIRCYARQYVTRHTVSHNLNLGVKLYTYQLVTQMHPLLRSLFSERFHCVHENLIPQYKSSYSVQFNTSASTVFCFVSFASSFHFKDFTVVPVFKGNCDKTLLCFPILTPPHPTFRETIKVAVK